MRLLHVDTKEVHDFQAAPYPPYAILSHTWGNDGDEVTFQEMMNLPTSSSSDAARVCQKPGYRKIEQCCARARADEIEYVWIDTCCIDKTSSAELSEAINSMYEWYRGSRICYALLSDVSTAPTGLFDDAESVIQGSRWLTRGWTLQELVAPAVVEFYAADWTEIGTKLSLAAALASITGIDQSVLAGRRSVLSCNVAERMSWAADRSTKRLEDAAYSLLGLFGVAMPLIYGEGRSRSFERLQEEIMRTTEDYTMFVWHIVPPPKQPPLPGGNSTIDAPFQEGQQQRDRITLPKTILPQAKAIGADIDSRRVKARAPLAESPAAFHISKTDWRDWRYSHLTFHPAGHDGPITKTTRNDWVTLGTLAPDYSPPQMTARGLRAWLSLYPCGPSTVLAYLNCTLHGRLVCTFLRRVGKAGTNTYERVMPSQGAYCFLPSGSTDAFRRQLVYITTPGNSDCPAGRIDGTDLSPPPFLGSRPQVEVQVSCSSKLELCASGWYPCEDNCRPLSLAEAEKSVVEVVTESATVTENNRTTMRLDFAKDNLPCLRGVYDNKYPFLVILHHDWCEVMYFWHGKTKLGMISKMSGGELASLVPTELAKHSRGAGGSPWDGEKQTWNFTKLRIVRSIVADIAASSSSSFFADSATRRRDRIIRHSGEGFAVAVAYKRLGNRSVVRVTVLESSNPGGPWYDIY